MDIEQRSPSEQHPSTPSSVALWAQRCADRRRPEQARTWVVNTSKSDLPRNPSNSTPSLSGAMRSEATVGAPASRANGNERTGPLRAMAGQVKAMLANGGLGTSATSVTSASEFATPSARLVEPSTVGELTLPVAQARSLKALEVQGPFVIGLAFGARSVGSSEAFGEASLSIKAEQHVLDAIELVEQDHRCVVRFAADVAWRGEPPVLVGVLPQLQDLSLGDEARAGVGAFDAKSLRIALRDRARAQVSAPDAAGLQELSVRCEGDSQLWVSTPSATPWSIENGSVFAAGQSRVNLSGAMFLQLDVQARDMSKVQAVQAYKLEAQQGQHAHVERREMQIPKGAESSSTMPALKPKAPQPQRRTLGTLSPA